MTGLGGAGGGVGLTDHNGVGGLVGQACVLQISVSALGQGLPPAVALANTARWRSLMPVPHERLHEDH